MIKTKQIRNSLLLVLTAFIWGVAFVAQSEGGDAIGPFSFNGLRSLLGGFVLLPLVMFMDKKHLTTKKPQNREDWKLALTGGICCGVVLCLATNLQQVGIVMGTPAGKAGFLTACYILLVPILGLFLKKKCGFHIWIAVVVAVVGLYLLCMTEELTVELSDILILLSALSFSVHILVVDHFSPLVDGVRLSCIQFLTCGFIGTGIMFFTEMKPFDGNMEAWLAPFAQGSTWIALLYAGIMSCGVAYTLQIVGQEGLNPTIASLLMSLESVFAVIAAAILLQQLLSPKEILGCVLMFAAIILAQLPMDKWIKRKIQNDN